jgi:hypothetical protein
VASRLSAKHGLLVALLLAACTAREPQPSHTGSPLDELPPHIQLLLDSGARADFSPDGLRIVYLEAAVGDVFELELSTRSVRKLTGHYPHAGYTRARHLASGDWLLCGPGPEDVGGAAERRWHTRLWLLRSDLSSPAADLGEPCFEGPAVSRRSLRIAWTLSDYPEQIVLARSEIWLGEIEIGDGPPRIVQRRKLVDRSAFHQLAFLETQDFRPPDERELLFTAYAWRGGEVMGVDLETGALRNYSRDWGYDEAEGVFPDGRSIAVEREPDTWTAVPRGRIDIWQLALDGSGSSRRLTHFSEYPGFGASNPVVDPSGHWMAFQLRHAGGEHGNGHGILLYDLQREALQARGPSH